MRKLVALSAAFVMAAGIASAQDKTIELRLSHWCRRRTRAEGAGGLGLVDREGLERHHQVQDLSSQQLGKAFDHYDMARDGIAGCDLCQPGYQPGRFPIIDAGNLPS